MSDSEEVADGETITLGRHMTGRCSVARRCREFYLRRLERMENMKRRWSMCAINNDDSSFVLPTKTLSTSDIVETVEKENLIHDEDVKEKLQPSNEERRKTNLDTAMNCLRQEITSLINQDNDLFRQLLTLHDSIVELRARQSWLMVTCSNKELNLSRTPSLDSLSDVENQTMSPVSTLSSSSSQSQITPSPSTSTNGNEMLSNVCVRCHSGSKIKPPLRSKTISYINLYTIDDVDSYDSGVNLQGCHSDSDHEIFV